MVNIQKLKGVMTEKKINAEELAKRCGMDRATLYRRLAKSDDFTIKEVDSIVKVLGLSMEETNSIFLRVLSHKSELRARDEKAG